MKRCCKVCEKEINIFTQKLRGHLIFKSNEGVCFWTSWFCSECVDEIKKINEIDLTNLNVQVVVNNTLNQS